MPGMAANKSPSPLPQPHGGRLRPLLISGDELAGETKRAASLPVIRMTSRETSDLIMLAMGAFSPLDGFMCSEDYTRVISAMHTSNGTLWPIPITLAATSEQAAELRTGTEAALVDGDSGTLMGLIRIHDKFDYDKNIEAKSVFQTNDPAHPGVAKLLEQGNILIGGTVKVFNEGAYPSRFGAWYARPSETRLLFENKGWKTVAAFQVRNPIHRSHEYCTKIALEITDGLLIHPLVGKLKKGDIPAEVRMKCYEVLLDRYYPKDRVVCRVYPMEMRYAGPREALLHAIIRQNFGCSHMIVGRDHAGVGNYYGPFAAQDIFDGIPTGELLIKPLKIDWAFWCYKCQSMASSRTCPHSPTDRLSISGTELRQMLERGRMPPPEFSRPEVLQILQQYYKDTETKQ